MATEITTLDSFLGKKVTFFRSKLKWPLKTLSSRLGISIQQLHRYEHGVNKIPASLLFELAHIFETDISSFFEGFQDNPFSNMEESCGYNILLIEDNPNDEYLLRNALNDFPQKLNIFTLNEKQATTNLFRESHKDSINLPNPDLVLFDLNIPFTQRCNILKDLKRRHPFQDIPIIVLTTTTNKEECIESYRLQASGLVRKSFSYSNFKDQLHKILSYWTETVELPRKSYNS